MAQRFHTALESGNGKDACDELSEATASKLESQERAPHSATGVEG